jgi:hypothetical protein
MENYLSLGEIDSAKISVSPKEQGKALYMQVEKSNQDINKGIIKDWGNLFADTTDILSIKRTEVEFFKQSQQYIPFLNW